VYFAYFSFMFRAQLGYRYLFMLLPMTYALAAIGTQEWWFRRRGVAIAFGIAGLALIELTPYFGHPIAFTNAVVLQKRNAFRYLADSNLYWNEYEAQAGELARNAGISGPLNPPQIVPGVNIIDANALSGVYWNFDQYRWVRDNLQTTGHIRHVLFVYDVSDADYARFLASAPGPPGSSP
jgi:hypothetical protein